MQSPPVVIAWESVPLEAVAPGVTRQVVQGTRQTVIRYRYAPGAVFPHHAHAAEQVTMVLRGRIAFDVAGTRVELGPGEAVIISGNVPHGAAVLGDDEVETLNTLAPRRDAHPESTR